MAITDQKPRKTYAVGPAAQTHFAVTFPIFADSDLQVRVGGVLKVLGTDYVVIGGTGGLTRQVMLFTPVSNTTVSIVRRIPIDRSTDFPAAGAFKVPSLNRELDRNTAIVQQVADDAARSMRPPADEDMDGTLPAAAARADRALGFDADGNPRASTVTLSAIEAATAGNLAAGRVIADCPPVVSDGTLTSIDTGYPIASTAQVVLTVGGIEQRSNYGASGTVVTFPAVPADVPVHVRIMGVSPDTPVGDVSYAPALPLASAATGGSSPNPAAVDHRHPLPTPADIGALTPTGNASGATATAAGTSTARPLSARFAESVNLLDFASHVSDGDWQAAFAAAVAAIPVGGATLLLPPQQVTCGAQVAIANKSVNIIGRGMGVSAVLFNGATGGFSFSDANTSANSAATLCARDFSILTSVTGLTALRAQWRPCAFFFRRYAHIEALDIRTVDINAAQAWARGIHLSSVHGADIRSVSVTNRRDVPSGDGILIDGFSLANSITDRRLLYLNRAVAVDPLAAVLVGFGSQTTNFTPGELLTSTGGATGVILATVADGGSTGTLTVAPVAGTWTVGHTLSDPAGGNGTITAVDLTRTWGSEGLYLNGGEDVGVNYGLHADCTSDTAKKFIGIKSVGGHSNAYVEGVHLAYVSQAEVRGRLIYASANNAVGVRLIGVDDGDVVGNQIKPSSYSLTGTVGIKTEAATGGNVPNECLRATIQGNGIDSLATGISIGASSTYADVRFNRLTSCSVDIASAAATFPGTASGTLIQNNRLSVALDDQIVGPQTTSYRPDGGLVRFALQNATRTYSLNNYGTAFSPNGALVIADETAAANRLVLGTDGVVDVVSGAARISQTGNAISRLTMQNSQRTWALSVYSSAQSPAGGFALSDESAGRVALAVDTSGTISVSGTSVINAQGLAMTRPYTLSTLPSAAANPNAFARVTDGAGGKRIVESDGSNWNYMDGSLARAG